MKHDLRHRQARYRTVPRSCADQPSDLDAGFVYMKRAELDTSISGLARQEYSVQQFTSRSYAATP
jgi:hypothetical protein